jgi:hypothetical protein
MKTVKVGIVLGVCTLLLLTTCRTTPKQLDELAIKELTRKDLNGENLGYFTLREHNKNGEYGPVFIFTERHTSRLVQAEIAWGLDVLRETRGINSVALEGMFKGEVMDAEKLTYSTDTEKYIVTLALLEHGEIKAPELMYLAQDSFVFGMEDEKQYRVMQPTNMLVILLNYFIFSIGTDRGINALDAILAELPKELDSVAIDWLFSQNPWFRETFEIINYSRSEHKKINRLIELEEKVGQFALMLAPQTRANFKLLKEFYETAFQRSLTMASHVLDTLRIKNEPLSMIIGAGHTEDVVEFFEENNVSYYVLEPRGLYDFGFWSDLTNAEYGRRTAGLPFFANRQIERFFTNEHNPRPVVGKDWSKRENSFALLANNMIGLAKSGQIPKDQYTPVFFSNGLNISRDSLDVSKPNDIKFFVENERGERLYARAVLNPQGNRFGSFQKALEEIIERLYQIDEENPPFSERIKAYEGLIEVFNVDDYAVFISPSSKVWDDDFISTL